MEVGRKILMEASGYMHEEEGHWGRYMPIEFAKTIFTYTGKHCSDLVGGCCYTQFVFISLIISPKLIVWISLAVYYEVYQFCYFID